MKTASLALFTSTVLAQTRYGENHVSVNFDSQLVEQKAFPAPNTTLYSPAFKPNATFAPGWSEGTDGATSQEVLDDFISDLATRNPAWMTHNIAEFLSEEGKSIPYVYLSSSGSNASSYGTSVKLKVWIQGSVHGNEPAGDEATLALLGAMDADPEWAAEFLEKMDILVLPRYNPDGNAYFQRTLATNYDPNRDHTKLRRQQTRGIKRLFSAFAPHVAIDQHEYGAATRYAGNFSNAADGMYSAAKNMNIASAIRELSETVFAPSINASLLSKGLRGEEYMTASRTNPPRLEEAGTDAKIGRNAMGLTQCITFLTEARGIGLANQQFKRRTSASFQMILGILNAAKDHADEVYATIEGAIANFVESDEVIVVTDYATYSNRTWTMVDRRTGQVVQLPVEFASTTPATANLTRARPEGYVIPHGWADLAERLRVSGLEVETMEEPFQGEVEAYNITSSSLAKTYYEGEILNTVTTKSWTQEVALPAGSFFVSSAQKNAGLAFVALEPENIDSYVSFGIVPVEVGDIYPVYRKLKD
ncbi:Zn-dependent exopeptidase [Lentithecium fluviatile CBS 122367]|uniref:Carboxypeptidase M14B n=1 Tax=Lentithecium fluviatile CBS 122367 TaxID=1168545 RepID=A0A6G1J9E0_9PLEO|nr:Zn-dependent exopeptidase [Lentithecium fluviatile CBS 122367]